jgi:hypothetical protein
MTTKLQQEPSLPESLRSRAREDEDVDVIRCRECGSSYPAVDGPAMLYSLKSPCLHCGGDCELVAMDEALRQVA